MGLNAAQEKPEDGVLERLQNSGIVGQNTFLGSFAPAVVNIVLNHNSTFGHDQVLHCYILIICFNYFFTSASFMMHDYT